MRVILKSRNGKHFATGDYDSKRITVLTGSKINMENHFPKMVRSAVEKRNDRNVVGEDGTVLADVTFDTVSAAAQFVTGRSVNGYIAWKIDDKISLKQYLEEHS